MSPIIFTKRLRNEQFIFESHSNNGQQFFKVSCSRIGRPFIMVKDKVIGWVIQPGQNVDPEIQEIEKDLSNAIKTNSK